MFKEKFNVFFVFLILVIALSACKEKGSNSSEEEEVIDLNSPALVSTSSKNDAVISIHTPEIVFHFDNDISVLDATQIKINDGAIGGHLVDGKKLKISLNNLKAGSKYTITIPKTSIGNLSKVPSKVDIKHSFTADKYAATNLSPEAKKVFAFLEENYGIKTVSGAMAKVDWNIEEAERVYRWTGKYPALAGFDYIHHHATWFSYKNASVVEDWWNNNGLVSIMWHWNVPINEGSNDYSFYTYKNGSGTTFDITKALKDGTSENRVLKEDLNEIADNLSVLQKKNIPVLWRPLHEASGGWFWWGAKNAASCKALWRLMFDTFEAKGLNNLIWIWTTEVDDLDWYPGDRYVDMIGRDMYNQLNEVSINTQFNSITTAYSGKIVALSEFGNVAPISNQWTSGAKWSWFMPWYDYNATGESVHQHATKEFWIDAFASGKVLTRDQMPNLK